MTDAQIRAAIEKYRSFFEKSGVPPQAFPHEVRFHRDHDVRPLAFAHCRRMLGQMLEFLDDGRREKTMRWLGFVQGCLWICGAYSINDLRDDNYSRE